MRIYTYDPKKKKSIFAGETIGDTFYTKRNNKEHYMRIEQGYGMQDDVLSQLMNQKINTICIHDEGGQHYSKIGDWYYDKPKDYGHGLQRFKREECCYANPNQINLLDNS